MKNMGSMAFAAALTGFASPALAQPYPQGPWDGPYMAPPAYGGSYHGRDAREGKIEAASFVASSPNIGRLGHGPIVLSPGTGGADQASFESALVDQLARAGYQTDAQPQAGGQTIEFVVRHDVIQPPEPPHSPVGGGVAVGAGSHGWGGVGLGINIDLSKPLKALVATRIEARIRDSQTHELLWQGRAQVIARDGDKRWTPQATAAKLAAALFKGFPNPS
jgi:hypothetical protein